MLKGSRGAVNALNASLRSRTMLHPSAVIHPEAKLGDGVEVGPFAVIESGARIGAGCVIAAHAVIGGRVILGEGNVIGSGAILGGDPQDLAFRPETESYVRIGQGNRIGEHVTIHRGTTLGSATVVGDGCFLMAGVHLAHNVRLGDGVIIANNALLGGYVAMDDGVFIGGGCVFHQHVRIGRLAICQGLSGFGKDIPPFTLAVDRSVVAGLNVVGLRRAGLSADERAEIKAAFTLLYRSGRNVAQALAAARERTWGANATAFWDFVAGGKQRGLCRLARAREEPV